MRVRRTSLVVFGLVSMLYLGLWKAESEREGKHKCIEGWTNDGRVGEYPSMSF